jgi:hypothetical protein
MFNQQIIRAVVVVTLCAALSAANWMRLPRVISSEASPLSDLPDETPIPSRPDKAPD